MKNFIKIEPDEEILKKRIVNTNKDIYNLQKQLIDFQEFFQIYENDSELNQMINEINTKENLLNKLLLNYKSIKKKLFN